MAGEELFEIATDFEKYGERLLQIDESQKAPDFAVHLKAMNDLYRIFDHDHQA